ncbi:sensor histidine kinase [Lawsonibacter sp. LCP25S3_G6]|uniref:sensor histidine kinase n=1 Tax=unclassified Lawsonibacter TaxID=2617946 RepID=UPI003F9B83BB
MFKKLKRRFILTNMAMLSAVLLLSFAAVYLITAYQIQNQNLLKLENIHSTTLRYQEANERNDSFQIVGVAQEYADAFGVIVNEQNQVVFDSSFGVLSREWIDQAVQETHGHEEGQIVLEGRRFLFSRIPAYAKVDSASENVAVEQFSQIAFLDITASRQSLLELLASFVVVGILTLLAMLGISALFAKRAVAPIERSYRKQKQFVQDASHELKTPLASIRANLEALQTNRQETIQSQEKWLDYISHETRRMNKLVTELLELARADQTEQAVNLEPICLSNLLERTLLSVETVLYEKGIALQQQIETDISVNGNPDKAEQVIRILLDNACKYTNTGGAIEVCLRRQRKYAVLVVSNTGEGIAPEHMDKIFDRFYRVDDSRKHTGSYGLGLPIAKALVEQMGATLSVSSVPHQKTTFSIRWELI